MSHLFDTLTIYDWIFTAIVAYFITSVILHIINFIKEIKKMKHRQMISVDYFMVEHFTAVCVSKLQQCKKQ